MCVCVCYDCWQFQRILSSHEPAFFDIQSVRELSSRWMKTVSTYARRAKERKTMKERKRERNEQHVDGAV